jgi:hypothetical protein
MHAARIDSDSKPGILFRAMKCRPCHLWSAWELAALIETTCLSTHISALRLRAPALGWKVPEATQKGKHFYYQIRRVKSKSSKAV